MPRPKEGRKEQVRCDKLAKQIDTFLLTVPLTADRKAVQCLTELRDELLSRKAGGLRWARDAHIINWLAWRRILEK